MVGPIAALFTESQGSTLKVNRHDIFSPLFSHIQDYLGLIVGPIAALFCSQIVRRAC